MRHPVGASLVDTFSAAQEIVQAIFEVHFLRAADAALQAVVFTTDLVTFETHFQIHLIAAFHAIPARAVPGKIIVIISCTIHHALYQFTFDPASKEGNISPIACTNLEGCISISHNQDITAPKFVTSIFASSTFHIVASINHLIAHCASLNLPIQSSHIGMFLSHITL